MSDDLAKRLYNLWHMLEEEGLYTKANTVTLAEDRIEELESLVEYAFREGVRAGLSDVPGSRTWENSAVYRKLKGDGNE